MKYIRTKDKIVIVDNEKYEIVEINDMTLLQTQFKNKQMFREYIIKQADTIEELCDAFVVIHKELNGSHTVHRYNWLGKSEYKMGNEVYGAIWTDKGLIYVAKLNDKGELELL